MMGVPMRSNNVLVGSLIGKPNKKKLTRIYNEAYQQISHLWNMLPESTKMCLKSESGESESMEVDNESLTRKDKIQDLEDRINSLKGKQNSYKEKMAKKKLKNQLKKKKKSEVKQSLKEEMRQKKKALKEQKLAEKIKSGEIGDSSAIEKRIGQAVDDSSDDEEEEEEDVEESEEDVEEPVEESSPKVKKNKGKQVQIEELAQKDGEEEENKQGANISKKKQKLLKKQELKAVKKREKRKLVKQRKKEVAMAKAQELIKTELPVPAEPVAKNKTTEVMFNKIDLEGENAKKKYKKEKPRAEKDPAKALTKLEELNKKITDLKEAGDEEKAAAIKSKESWKAAILKADGVKVKDDVKLLKKTIKRKENKKNKSKTDWAKRIEMNDKKMADAQKKRKENIQKKKKEKKQKKIKKSIKKGRIVI